MDGTKQAKKEAILQSWHEMISFFEDVGDDILEEAHYALVMHLEDTIPERACGCLHSPPCSDCVNFGYQRELIEAANEAIRIRIPDYKKKKRVYSPEDGVI